jgi:hypothetical protein
MVLVATLKRRRFSARELFHTGRNSLRAIFLGPRQKHVMALPSSGTMLVIQLGSRIDLVDHYGVSGWHALGKYN